MTRIICIPIMTETNEAALGQMPLCFAMADMVELRIDAIKNLDLPSLLSSPGGKVVVTNRKSDEGGWFSGNEEKRVALLCEAVSMKADFVDIELSTDPRLISLLVKTVKKYGGLTQLIVSHHDFTGTPQMDELFRIVDESYRRGADIVKIATYACSMKDNMTILNLIGIIRRRNRNIIAFCMGETGKISRIAAPMFGSFMTFAAREKGTESAPGQLTVHEIKEIFRILQ
ncbi:MAG TPA: type I 3-dehydroquinate dehydratase [Deltaproteobacteria bacterium]|nr:type I 3-dehydroquinate dehydratase [Deltaproteobacteria bacterium]